MSMMLMYWLVKFDDIRKVSCGLGMFFLFCAIMTIPLLVDGDHKKWFCLTKILVAGFLMGIATWTFLPSTKQMAAIVLVPAVLNNKDVQEIGAKTADLGKDLLALTQAYVKEHLSDVDHKKGIKDSD